MCNTDQVWCLFTTKKLGFVCTPFTSHWLIGHCQEVVLAVWMHFSGLDLLLWRGAKVSECMECLPGPKEISFREVAVSGSSTCYTYGHVLSSITYACILLVKRHPLFGVTFCHFQAVKVTPGYLSTFLPCRISFKLVYSTIFSQTYSQHFYGR